MFNISLKKNIPRRNVKMSLLLKAQAELRFAYEDIREDYTIITNDSLSFFKYASFNFEDDDDTTLYRLHIGDVISINVEDGDNFAIIRAIFCHQKNDLRFAFIIVDWFEELNQTRLSCPVYKLQTTNDTNWRRVFSISLVNANNFTHFVHSCKGEECIGSNHNLRNDLYIQNLYFFKAV